MCAAACFGMRRHHLAQFRLSLGKTPARACRYWPALSPHPGRRDRVPAPVCIPARHRKTCSAFLRKQPGRQVRLGIFGLQRRGLMIGSHGLIGLRRFDHVRQRKPCPRLSLGNVAGGLSCVAARRNCSASGCPAFASCSPRFRFDSKTSAWPPRTFGRRQSIRLFSQGRSRRIPDRTRPRSSWHRVRPAFRSSGSASA